MPDITISAILFVASLAAVLVSTRQMVLWLRAIVWGLGVVCLVGAIVILWNADQHSGLFRAVGDLVANIGSPEQSVLGQALARNGPGVLRFILPVLDLFLLIGAAITILALFAFTPGEALEKIVRSLTTGLLGAMIGGVVALTIVGMGFGDFRKQRVYAAEMNAESLDRDIHDGDTFWLGEISLRLVGADAPEMNQTCFDAAGNENQQCGEQARDALVAMLRGRLVSCGAVDDRKVDDSFGRPLTTCNAGRRAERPGDDPRERAAIEDLSDRLVRGGFAVDYAPPLEGGRPSNAQVAATRGEGQSLLAGCMLRPKSWRRNRNARERFLNRDFDELDVIGAACGRIGVPASAAT
jgi:endonuclease YncB( thermonuclease family)